MFKRIIENLLMNTYNAARNRHDAHAKRHSSVADCPADHVILGAPIQTRPGNHSPQKPVLLSLAERKRHLYILGATGTGKTNLLLHLLESDIAQNHTCCVLDLRGDLVDRILLRIAHANPDPEAWRERLVLIDLRSASHIVGFNPLLGAGELHSRAMHLLAVLKKQSESWGVQLEETLRNCLLALAEAGWSLLEIEPLLTNPGFRAQTLSRVKDPYVRSFFERYDDLSEDKQKAWQLAVLNKVTPLLAIPVLRLTFGQRESFDFRDLLDKESGRIILISLAVDRLHDAAYLAGGLFLSAFQTAIMARVDTPEKARIPVHLYVDEFENMASDRFESIVAEGRRFGLGLCLSHQNLSQVPRRLQEVLLNNVHTQMYFQTGAGDALLLAREVGEKASEVRSVLTTQRVGEAFLVRRGEPSLRLRTFPCPDPRVDADVVRGIQSASFASYARPYAELEREFALRHARSEAESDAPPAAPVPSYEIRHAKPQGQYRPKRPK